MGVKFFFIIDRNRRHFLLANKCYLVDPFFVCYFSKLFELLVCVLSERFTTFSVIIFVLSAWSIDYYWWSDVTIGVTNVNMLFNITEKGVRYTNKTRYGRYSGHKNHTTMWTSFELYVNNMKQDVNLWEQYVNLWEHYVNLYEHYVNTICKQCEQYNSNFNCRRDEDILFLFYIVFVFSLLAF